MKNKIVQQSYYSNNAKTTTGQVINKLNIATSILGGVSAAAAVFATASYMVVAFSFGAELYHER